MLNIIYNEKNGNDNDNILLYQHQLIFMFNVCLKAAFQS